MLPAVVVIQEKQGHRVTVVFQLFAMGVRQSRHSAVVHPKGQVDPLDNARAHIHRVRESDHALLCASDTRCRGVAGFGASRDGLVVFD